MSNLIPITKIYDIYPKYTFSKDVMRFMDDIVDIPRAEVFSKADMVAMLEEIQLEIEELKNEPHCCEHYVRGINNSSNVIQQKINALRGNENE